MNKNVNELTLQRVAASDRLASLVTERFLTVAKLEEITRDLVETENKLRELCGLKKENENGETVQQ